MFERQLKSNGVRVITAVLATLGATHFAGSVFLWLVGLWAGYKLGSLDWVYFSRHAGPAVLLFGAFVTGIVLAWRSRALAVPVTIASIVTAVLCFIYDTSHHHYQIQSNDGSGCKHSYVTWYWYDDSHDPNR